MLYRTITAAILLSGCQPAASVGTFVPDAYVPMRHARVIFVGDGVTDGVGASMASIRYPALLVANDDRVWPEAAGADLASLNGAPPEVFDVALAGASSTDVITTQLPALDVVAGTGRVAVFATLGAPDLGLAFTDSNTTVGQAVDILLDNVAALADWTDDPARFPQGADLFLSTMLDITDGGATAACLPSIAHGRYADLLDQIHRGYRSLAEERSFVLVDAMGHFRGHGAEAADTWVTEACAYPNDQGHHELRRLFFQVVSEGETLPSDEPVWEGF